MIEGNTLSQELGPDLLLFVVDPTLPLDRYKAPAAELAHRSDYLIFNSRNGTESLQAKDSLSLKSQFLNQTGLSGIRDADRIVIEDVNRPLVQWHNDQPYNALASIVTN